MLENTIAVMICACVGYQLNVLTGPLSAYYQGINHPARTFGYLGWQLFFIGVGLLVAWRYVGFDVVIIAEIAMLARVLSALIYLCRGNYQLGLGHWRFIRLVMWPGIMPYLFGYGIMTAIQPWLIAQNANRWQLIIILGIIGVFYVLLTGGFFYAFMCGKEEQEQVRQKLTRRKS